MWCWCVGVAEVAGGVGRCVVWCGVGLVVGGWGAVWVVCGVVWCGVM